MSVSSSEIISSPPRPRPKSGWEAALERLGDGPASVAEVDRSESRVHYRLNLRDSRMRDQLVVDLFEQSVKSDGTLGLPRPLEVDESAVQAWPDDDDRTILQLLLGNAAEGRHEARLDTGRRFARSVVRPGMYDLVLQRLCRTERWFVDDGRGSPSEAPIRLEATSVSAQLRVDVSANPPGFRLWGGLRVDGEHRSLDTVELVLGSGLVVVDGHRLLRLPPVDASWVARLKKNGPVHVAPDQRDAFILQLAKLEDLPEIELPPELHWSRVVIAPQPVLQLEDDVGSEEAGATARVLPPVVARLRFAYGDAVAEDASRGTFATDPAGRTMFKRDRRLELKARTELEDLGGRRDPEEPDKWRFSRRDLGTVVRSLAERSWRLEAGGAPLRRSAQVKSKVRSSIDWFELEAVVDFDGVEVSVPELLKVRGAGPLVRLPDGSRALAPDWLDRYLALARSGRSEGRGLRFSPSQAGLIDALLVGEEDADIDLKFRRLRREPPDGRRVKEPPGFKGRLRPYQRDGVAWLQSLELGGSGGCLADDMGLGKTVQVLCWLQERHRKDPVGPSLVVVPKSLVFNWIAEARKFTDLRAVSYVGPQRKPEILADHDVVVTTYGTLRSDILKLLDLRFEVVILDEAQSIKNPRSQAAKAAKLVRARQRLAFSGTPIENGLTELWSIFDFVNPGMLGPLDQFAAGNRERDETWLELLQRALRPIMLRRTKDGVLTDLPGKTEQTVVLELPEEERRRYDELLEYYRVSLKQRVERDGISASRIQVLEALLRLRQASCHPGLIDPARSAEPSAKVDFLVDRVRELAQRGHKCLIFSQFTRLLDIVRARLREAGVDAAYLDGQTRDRSQVVRTFQEDPNCAAFLISLKAGGCGLNLVQSDYVFLLDPWWNPAVEAQAIDRAYRMGQKRHVFAYRLIAKDTVEDKIMALKADKRRVADAVVVPRGFGVEEIDEVELDALFS